MPAKKPTGKTPAKASKPPRGSARKASSSKAAPAAPADQDAERLFQIMGSECLFAQRIAGWPLPVVAEPDLKSVPHTGDPPGSGYLRLSHGKADAPSWGKTHGLSLQLPAEIERAASGRQIVVSIVARAAAAPKARFAAAYSTNEVGNSGWRWFEAGRDWNIFRFTFAVPPMNAGNDDFVGLLPDVAGEPAVDVFGIGVAVA